MYITIAPSKQESVPQ